MPKRQMHIRQIPGGRRSISEIPTAFSCKSRRGTDAEQTYGDQIHGTIPFRLRRVPQPIKRATRTRRRAGHKAYGRRFLSSGDSIWLKANEQFETIHSPGIGSPSVFWVSLCAIRSSTSSEG